MKYKKDNSGVYVWLFLGAVVIFGVYVYFENNASNVPNGKYDVFAQCLAQKNITMYGEATCPYCQREKAAFGDSFKYVPYVECPDNAQLCIDKGIEGYPTWIYPDGSKTQGFQELSAIAQKSGCELPK